MKELQVEYAKTVLKVMDGKVVRKASYATFTLFFIFGVLVNSWYSRMPSVRNALDLSALQLSQILIVGAIGSVIGLPFVGYVNEKYGSKKVISFAIVGYVIMMFCTLFFMNNKSMLMVSLSFFTAQLIMSFSEGSINIEGGRIEIAMQKSIISAYHGGFSLGTVFAAIVASVVSYMGINIYYHLGVVYVIGLTVMVVVAKYALPHEYLRTIFLTPRPVSKSNKTSNRCVDKKENEKPKFDTRKAWREKRTLLIGVTILGSALTEGAANGWLSLSLIESFNKTEAYGAFALGIFVASMTMTRMLASPFVEKYGRVKVLRTCTALGGIGLLIFVFSPWVQLCLVGILAWAIGSALGFPLGMSAASDDPLKASSRVAVTSTIAYASFFLGPAVIGAIAEYVGYRWALLVIIVPIVVALIFIPILKPLPKEK